MAWTLKQLAELVGGTLVGEQSITIDSVATLQDAKNNQISFLTNKLYKQYLSDTKAAAVILDETTADDCATNKIIVNNPHSAFAIIATALHPAQQYTPGIHSSAVIDESSKISNTSRIDANSVVGKYTVVGENCNIGAGVVIGDNVSIGENSVIYANVTIYSGVVIGKNAILHSGCVIGADGFGHAFDETQGWIKVPQVGGVEIGDDVEIGASTTIDRGAIKNTVIGNGVRLDNQIQVGHNAEIGDHTVIAACSGIAGSAIVGKRCMIGGFVAIAGHISIADDVMITACTMITKTITKKGSYSAAFSAEPTLKWRKLHARFKQLDNNAIRMRKLEKQQS